ncbi:hypothetical protein [Furfurilactobacillus milii]|uniref:Uncharacterized protein n=1 Tax=Furfurilactobacillus milii TaxID=2888272 RepID=A0ABT6DDB9_9LACO|nr:hypothetical protein [Furfurilactobacillus milii]QLE67018.1 hypothetical protein LROSL2_1668 [Furfurilactobacillus rossiae]MCF6161278.1 hypothetical protein [Furfurilactobacillus milii]MCF6163658.1 hypothetical protein [Furfurilactobacillus milii]MDF9914154.1 hypothetical protein [Furfurilactobacillus milii]QLE69448.1 hypothetical protein LROSL3_1669 [Furfurilactobacillus rossiae]
MTTVVVNEGSVDLVNGASVQAHFEIHDVEQGVLLVLTNSNVSADQLVSLMNEKEDAIGDALADATNQDVNVVSWRDAAGQTHQLQ